MEVGYAKKPQVWCYDVSEIATGLASIKLRTFCVLSL